MRGVSFCDVSASETSTKDSFPRGSEWRKWDLHVHTPLSALNNGFGDDFDAYAKSVFLKAIDAKIALIGVTDYFTIDGYKRLRSIQKEPAHLAHLLGDEGAERAQGICLIPNIEFRLSDFVRVGEKDSRVNAHILFSDKVETQEIEENFLHRLRFVADSSPGDRDTAKSLTAANLEAFGARLKDEHKRFADRSDLELGMTQATVSHGEISELLDQNRAAFRGRYLFVVEADEDLSDISWDGQGHSTRKTLIRKSHMLYSANAGTREFALGLRSESVAAFEAEFGGRKPCVHGSDAHSTEELFEFDSGRSLWVRADPTFNGLAQLCHEPADRIYVGQEPPALLRARSSATKVIREVSFDRDEDAGPDAKWFSGAIPLNHGLVAIVGKKGSGKSALADIIGLLADAQASEDFSFLRDTRFLNPKHALGRHFRATLTWCSGDSESRTLDAEPDAQVPERVRHIPQNYLETICAEIQESSAPTLFDQELEGVIFSHVPRADQLGCTSLTELFGHTTAETEARIGLLRKKLAQINREYTELRRRGSADSRRRLEAELAQRRGELEAHLKAKPAEVADPSRDRDRSPEAAKAEDELESVVKRIEELDGRTSDLGKREALLKRQRVALSRMLSRIDNLETSIEEFYEQSSDDAALLDLDPRRVVTFNADTSDLVKLREAVDEELAEIADALDSEREESEAGARRRASEKANQLRKKLAEPQQRRQEYLRAVSNWQKRTAEIEGSASDLNSLVGLKARVEELETLPDKAAGKREERVALVGEIYKAKSELLDSYRKLYRPVQNFMAEERFAEEVSALSFDAEIRVHGLEDGLLDLIHHGRRGSFQGEQEGRERLRAIVAGHDFSTPDGVVAFLQEIGDHLAHDVRSDDRPAVELEKQLVAAATVEGVYDFLFGLEYLEPRFKLLWRGKPLDQLSPGERGTLLLIFYLLIDREDIPLVIDQPEENLDNETVAELLVPAIKNAKARRQIIMVTHNPNLAVVCDADQVVHASIDKTDGNRITYTSGSLEDPRIAQLIVDVLEGTKPAFDLRDAKYEVLDRGV
jgi:energy-coupling factor transporter ATP-binding protein EcfA2